MLSFPHLGLSFCHINILTGPHYMPAQHNDREGWGQLRVCGTLRGASVKSLTLGSTQVNTGPWKGGQGDETATQRTWVGAEPTPTHNITRLSECLYEETASYQRWSLRMLSAICTAEERGQTAEFTHWDRLGAKGIQRA